jgi:hypothetical protein
VHDNRLETVCILVLLYGYLASVLTGFAPVTGVNTAAALLKAAIVIYAVWRALGRKSIPHRAVASATAFLLRLCCGPQAVGSRGDLREATSPTSEIIASDAATDESTSMDSRALWFNDGGGPVVRLQQMAPRAAQAGARPPLSEPLLSENALDSSDV